MSNGQKKADAVGTVKVATSPKSAVADVRVRTGRTRNSGTASHVAEKYLQPARNAQSSGDPVAAETIISTPSITFGSIAAAQEQFRREPAWTTSPAASPRGNLPDDADDDVKDHPASRSAANRCTARACSRSIRRPSAAEKRSRTTTEPRSRKHQADERRRRRARLRHSSPADSSSSLNKGKAQAHGPNGQNGANGQMVMTALLLSFPAATAAAAAPGPAPSTPMQGGDGDAPMPSCQQRTACSD